MQGFEAMLRMVGVDPATLQQKMAEMTEGVVSMLSARFDRIEARLEAIEARLPPLHDRPAPDPNAVLQQSLLGPEPDEPAGEG